MVGHKPGKIRSVGNIGEHNLVLRIARQRAQGVVRTRNLAVEFSFNPQRIVVDTHFKPLRFRALYKLFERHRAVVRHVDTTVAGKLRQEAVGAYHVVAVGLELGSHHVDDSVPLVGAKIHLVVRHSGNLPFAGIFIDCPVKRRFVIMSCGGNGQFWKFGSRRFWDNRIVLFFFLTCHYR